VKKPIPDKAEVAIEYPDNLYCTKPLRGRGACGDATAI
jgi:hypothetical protein